MKKKESERKEFLRLLGAFLLVLLVIVSVVVFALEFEKKMEEYFNSRIEFIKSLENYEEDRIKVCLNTEGCNLYKCMAETSLRIEEENNYLLKYLLCLEETK